MLLIENWDKKGESDFLVDRLRSEDIAVTVASSDRLFTSLAELQRYDSVILANVSRSTGTDAENVSSFSDEQIDMLVRNTREMGCGLIMLGGPDTFGAGGWTNTELEKAMPVDFEIKNAKVTPVGALVLMMHAGEMPKANYWQKRIAIESIKQLGGRDYCGLVQWNMTDQWLWGQSKGGVIRVGPNRKMMMGRVDKMQIGDMPAFDPALKMAAKAFAGLPDAAVKHMIIISDGDPSPPSAIALNSLKNLGVKISTVAVGSHGTIGSREMQRISSITGGKYYVVKNAKALPRIYQREARRIARPLAYEMKPAVAPSRVAPHEMLQGLESGLPPISGFVLTSVKQNPLVEVLVQSPKPATEKNATILASWTYGAGKAVAFTTDTGARWANQWTQWDNYDKFFSQMVRWSMRPTDDSGNFSIATDVGDGRTKIIITALTEDDEFLNDQAMTATVVTPDMASLPVRVEQTAPGRYVGEFDSEAAGSYLLVVNPGEGRAPIRSGVNVGYSAEYKDNQTNMALLRAFADLKAKGGPAGVIVEAGLGGAQDQSVEPANPFRRDLEPAISDQSIWPILLVVGSCLFFADVFVRRVQVNFLWVVPMLATARDFVLRRQREAPTPETMSRLRSRKQQVTEQIESRRAATRFEDPEHEHAPDPASIATSSSQPTAAPKPQSKVEPEEQPAEESYTERLLKAKRKVWNDRDHDGPGGDRSR